MTRWLCRLPAESKRQSSWPKLRLGFYGSKRDSVIGCSNSRTTNFRTGVAKLPSIPTPKPALVAFAALAGGCYLVCGWSFRVDARARWHDRVAGQRQVLGVRALRLTTFLWRCHRAPPASPPPVVSPPLRAAASSPTAPSHQPSGTCLTTWSITVSLIAERMALKFLHYRLRLVRLNF
jgi:hypothetical protein